MSLITLMLSDTDEKKLLSTVVIFVCLFLHKKIRLNHMDYFNNVFTFLGLKGRNLIAV